MPKGKKAVDVQPAGSFFRTEYSSASERCAKHGIVTCTPSVHHCSLEPGAGGGKQNWKHSRRVLRRPHASRLLHYHRVCWKSLYLTFSSYLRLRRNARDYWLTSKARTHVHAPYNIEISDRRQTKRPRDQEAKRAKDPETQRPRNPGTQRHTLPILFIERR